MQQNLDFRCADVNAGTEPVISMNETLAHGLVKRFVGQWSDLNLKALHQNKPPETQKRAAAYRAICKWLVRSVPEQLRIVEFLHGDQSGRDKRALFGVVYWEPDEECQWLRAVMRCASARGGLKSRELLGLSKHALVRLFQRLKTMEPAQVLSEASAAIRNYQPWHWVHEHVLGLPEILVPTPHGAMVLARKDDAARRGGRVCAKTWMSDARMVETAKRIGAVRSARSESGFVLIANGDFVVVSGKRLEGGRSHQDVYNCIRSQLSGSSSIAFCDSGDD